MCFKGQVFLDIAFKMSLLWECQGSNTEQYTLKYYNFIFVSNEIVLHFITLIKYVKNIKCLYLQNSFAVIRAKQGKTFEYFNSTRKSEASSDSKKVDILIIMDV